MPFTNIHLEIDGGWRVMKMTSQSELCSLYWLAHEHLERDKNWRYVDLKKDIKSRKMKCVFCGAVAPSEALGFVNLLEGDMLYDEGK